MLGHVALAAGFDFAQRARGGAHAYDSPESVAPGRRAAFESNPEPVVLLTDVVAEEQMRLALRRGQEDIQVAVVVEVGKNGGAAIRDGIDARNARDIQKLLAVEIQGEDVALIAAEGETFLEDEPQLLRKRGELCLVRVVRHDVTPEQASSVLH